MARLPTRTVLVKSTGTLANINVTDFDPQLHEETGTKPSAAPPVVDPEPEETPDEPEKPRQPKKRSTGANGS